MAASRTLAFVVATSLATLASSSCGEDSTTGTPDSGALQDIDGGVVETADGATAADVEVDGQPLDAAPDGTDAVGADSDAGEVAADVAADTEADSAPPLDGEPTDAGPPDSGPEDSAPPPDVTSDATTTDVTSDTVATDMTTTDVTSDTTTAETTPADTSSDTTSTETTPADTSTDTTSTETTPTDTSTDTTSAETTPTDTSTETTPADASTETTPADTSTETTPTDTSAETTPADTTPADVATGPDTSGPAACSGDIPGECPVFGACSVDGCVDGVRVHDRAAREGQACASGNRCLQSTTCHDGACTVGTPVVCDGPCSTGVCDPNSGCVPKANGTSCDDGAQCSTNDRCQSGVCRGDFQIKASNECEQVAFVGIECTLVDKPAGAACSDDGDPCTADTCDGTGACTHAPRAVGAACTSRCGGPGTCSAAGQCLGNDIDQCGNRGTACGVGVCDPAVGCVMDYFDPACELPNAWCIDGTTVCQNGTCGDGWCSQADMGAACWRDCLVNFCPYEFYCDHYGATTWAGTRRSHLSVAYGFSPFIAYQTETLTQQLQDGIRWLDLVVDYCQPGATSGPLCLCVGDDDCLGGKLPIGGPLQEIADFMATSTWAIVSLHFREFVADGDLYDAVVDAGLDAYLYRRTSFKNTYEKWPLTVQQMIVKNQRLVVFGGPFIETWQVFQSDVKGAAPVGDDGTVTLNDIYLAESVWACEDAAGSAPPAQGVYVLSHFDNKPSWSGATCDNIASAVRKQLEKCRGRYARPVGVLLVDFYNSGSGPLYHTSPGGFVRYADQCLIDGDLAGHKIPHCETDADCTGGRCGGLGTCITCFDDFDCAESQWCNDAWGQCLSDQADGSLCGSDSTCSSGYCNFICIGCEVDADCDAEQWCDVSGACKPKWALAHACVSNRECLSDLCSAGFCADCDEQSDCGAGTFCTLSTLFGGSTCIDRKPEGEGCVNDFECDSGNCWGTTCAECDEQADCAGGTYCTLPVVGDVSECAPVKALDDACLSDFECASGACWYGRCAECGAHDDCLDREYCTLPAVPLTDSVCLPKKEPGEPCLSSIECDGVGCVFGAGICGECGADGDCSVGEFCDLDYTCMPKVANGHACGIDRACQSGNCLFAACAECNEHSDCPASKFCTLLPGGAATCQNDKPQGAACTSKEECISNACTGVVCGECEEDSDCGSGKFCDVTNTCRAKVALGVACTEDAACLSGQCFLGFCAGCNEHSDCNATQFCTLTPTPGASACAAKKANGAVCTSPTECMNGACHSAVCSSCDEQSDCAADKYCTLSIGSASTCVAKKPNGDACATAVECTTGKCTGFKCGECAVHGDCAANKHCDNVIGGSFTCKLDVANGQACDADAWCTSGICDAFKCVQCTTLPQEGCNFSSHYCLDATCRAKKANGVTCAVDDQCTSGICDLFTCVQCTSAPEEGCDFATQYCESATCKAKKANGQSCGFDDQCVSDKCSGGTCRTPCTFESQCAATEWCDFLSGSCQPNKANGAVCTDNKQCSSDHCNVGFCVACVTHAHCAANQYCDNPVGASFTCKPDRATPEGCNTKEWCTSNICDAGTCVDCLNHSDCTDSVNNRCLDIVAGPNYCVDCLADGDCTASKWCDIDGNHGCKADKGAGSVCTRSSQCTSACCVFKAIGDDVCGSAGLGIVCL